MREAYQARFIFSETGTSGLQIEGAGDTFYLDTQNVRTQMKRLGLQRWSVRFADEMDLEAFFDRFGKRLERHPETGAFGRWLNPLGQWDWWDLGGRFDGRIVADEQVKEGRSVAEISSGPNMGRAILAISGMSLPMRLGWLGFLSWTCRATGTSRWLPPCSHVRMQGGSRNYLAAAIYGGPYESEP